MLCAGLKCREQCRAFDAWEETTPLSLIVLLPQLHSGIQEVWSYATRCWSAPAATRMFVVRFAAAALAALSDEPIRATCDAAVSNASGATCRYDMTCLP